MKELTFQQELEREEELKEKFTEMLSEYNIEDLYLIREVLEKEIRLSNTAIKERFANE